MPIPRRTLLNSLYGSFLYDIGRLSSQVNLNSRLNVWYCPAVFTSNHTLREDYIASLTDNQTWEGLDHSVKILKFYIESLIPSSGHLSNFDLSALVKICDQHRLKAAFEVGALRTSALNFGSGSGERYAEQECLVLDRWVKAGGTIDFITADNPVMQTVGLIYKRGSAGLPKSYQPSLADIIGEATRAMAIFRNRYRNAALGSTESLGFFEVKTMSGTLKNLDPLHLPSIRFDDFLSGWLSMLSRSGVRADHFHIDFGIEGVQADGHGRGMNFERVAEVVNLLRIERIRSGLMVGAFDNFSLAHTPAPSVAAANHSAVTNTYNYLDGFLRAQIKVDDILLDRWEPYPDRTGPISDGMTDLGLTFGLTKRLALSGYL